MTLYQHKYRIESTRLKGWDYKSNGSYFITICTKDRDHLFGYVENNKMVFNQYGTIVNQCWFDLPNHYQNIRLDAFIVMPDHVHGIIIIDNHNFMDNQYCIDVETGLKPVSTFIPNQSIIPIDSTNQLSKRHGLFEIVRAFKTFSGRRINELRLSSGKPVWQSRFHDHIIRDENEYFRIRQYIINNPNHYLEH